MSRKFKRRGNTGKKFARSGQGGSKRISKYITIPRGGIRL